jgi:hypothetical protein
MRTRMRLPAASASRNLGSRQDQLLAGRRTCHIPWCDRTVRGHEAYPPEELQGLNMRVSLAWQAGCAICVANLATTQPRYAYVQSRIILGKGDRRVAAGPNMLMARSSSPGLCVSGISNGKPEPKRVGRYADTRLRPTYLLPLLPLTSYPA